MPGFECHRELQEGQSGPWESWLRFGEVGITDCYLASICRAEKGGYVFWGNGISVWGSRNHDVGQFEVSGSKERFSWDLNVARKQYFFTGCTATVCLETCVSV